MELQPPNEPVPDPFLASVRRRHPDVDIVALPPESASAPADEPADDATVAATVDRLQQQATELWSHVAEEADGPTVELAFGPLPDTVVARSRHAASVPDRPGILDELHDALQGEGWEFRRPWGEVERLIGRLDGVELRATYAAETGALLVVLTSAALRVGPGHARELVRH
jgi:hypothetical protein